MTGDCRFRQSSVWLAIDQVGTLRVEAAITTVISFIVHGVKKI
jgi:hypothetical protein